MIHRIVGAPGDTLEMRDNVLLRNGKRVVEPYIMLTPDIPAVRSFGPVEVPPGNYFLLGDNRDNANDSRFQGFIPEGKIRGRISTFSTSESAAARRDRRIRPMVDRANDTYRHVTNEASDLRRIQRWPGLERRRISRASTAAGPAADPRAPSGAAETTERRDFDVALSPRLRLPSIPSATADRLQSR
jgi:signal peptidase I